MKIQSQLQTNNYLLIKQKMNVTPVVIFSTLLLLVTYSESQFQFGLGIEEQSDIYLKGIIDNTNINSESQAAVNNNANK